MLHIVPDYYIEFRCIGGSCRHNCCIGWEIDIDADSAAYYAAVPGEMGVRLQKNIDFSAQPPHFILGEGERCPFLNGENLCDIYAQLGENRLCGICADHPRFRNELPGRIETGLGLCCEEAARLILCREEPLRLVRQDALPEETGEAGGIPPGEDAILALRDEVLALLQDRSRTIPQRMDTVLQRCGAVLPARTMPEWKGFLLGLERLDESWTQTLTLLDDLLPPQAFAAFDAHMTGRQYEYEQFACYLVYRHFANAPDAEEAAVRAAFAVWGWRLLYTLGAALYAHTGEFSFAQQAELARQFSSELEYCEDNLYAIWDELYAAME